MNGTAAQSGYFPLSKCLTGRQQRLGAELLACQSLQVQAVVSSYAPQRCAYIRRRSERTDAAHFIAPAACTTTQNDHLRLGSFRRQPARRILDAGSEYQHSAGLPKAPAPERGKRVLDYWWTAIVSQRQISDVYLSQRNFKHFERWAERLRLALAKRINDGTTTRASSCSVPRRAAVELQQRIARVSTTSRSLLWPHLFRPAAPRHRSDDAPRRRPIIDHVLRGQIPGPPSARFPTCIWSRTRRSSGTLSAGDGSRFARRTSGTMYAFRR